MLDIIKDFIPKGRINRPETSNGLKYIIIHETDNTASGANAKSHAKYIKTIKNKTSWHYTVDDTSIYQHIPDIEKSYSTSDKHGNENGIAIEICVNKDGNFSKACDNTIELVRYLCKKYNISKDNIKQHYDFSKKECPRNLRKNGWSEFLNRCYVENKSKLYRVQVGAFSNKDNALKLANELKSKGYNTIIV